MKPPGIRQLVNRLQSRQLTPLTLIERAYQQAIQNRDVFTEVDDGVLETAMEVEKRYAVGTAGLLEGIPVAIKDLYHIRGQKTLAGSKVLRDTAPVEVEDAEVVAHLRADGLLFLGRTHMSEFAFSGMGLNPHYPPLYSVWDRETGRLPGGSSSGSAVGVALGIVPGTLGSDTAGSCRIPAAFNGIVGVKPSYGRLSLNGVYPLSPTSDAPGPLGVDVDTCFILDHLMTGMYHGKLPTPVCAEPQETTLLVPEGLTMCELDLEVEKAFSMALHGLARSGIRIKRQAMPILDDCIRQFLERPIVPFEVWQAHAERLQSRGEEYDPFVRQRMSMGQYVSIPEQESRYAEKAQLVRRFHADFRDAGPNALMLPTVPCIPPPVSATKDADQIGQVNLRCLRNTVAVNYFDGCAISLPCHLEGEAPVGLMLSMPHGHDQKLYELAFLVEKLLGR